LALHRIIPSLGPGTFRGPKYLFDCAGDHPHCLRRLTALHRPRLPTPRLAIREDCAVIPIRNALYELTNILEHLALARAGFEYAVEGEQRSIHAFGARSCGRGRGEGNFAVVPLVRESYCGGWCVGREFGWERRTNADVDSDVACA